MDWIAPSCDEIEQAARAVVATFPPLFRNAAQHVALQVADFAEEEVLAEMELEPFELTGLYEGIPLTDKSSFDQPAGPDIVWLFRRPILDEWAGRADVTLTQMIAHVTVHEFAHHFGWSDGQIAAIDRWWE